jgi:hypothetical protein
MVSYGQHEFFSIHLPVGREHHTWVQTQEVSGKFTPDRKITVSGEFPHIVKSEGWPLEVISPMNIFETLGSSI